MILSWKANRVMLQSCTQMFRVVPLWWQLWIMDYGITHSAMPFLWAHYLRTNFDTFIGYGRHHLGRKNSEDEQIFKRLFVLRDGSEKSHVRAFRLWYDTIYFIVPMGKFVLDAVCWDKRLFTFLFWYIKLHNVKITLLVALFKGPIAWYFSFKKQFYKFSLFLPSDIHLSHKHTQDFA